MVDLRDPILLSAGLLMGCRATPSVGASDHWIAVWVAESSVVVVLSAVRLVDQWRTQVTTLDVLGETPTHQ